MDEWLQLAIFCVPKIKSRYMKSRLSSLINSLENNVFFTEILP